ncbi:MAG TPA: class I SAM-dependent methyltransferase [Candidatus Saccharimonadales bacterium]|jgi:23S rRNA (cytosine1962-C5)-methyltransferase|nr:class I SAM-dependent methyltransferase [Candidatus Saccharimonadales bacterium]
MEYELIDSGNGRRFEKFGDYVLDRPDPEVLWQKNLPEDEWSKADAIFKENWINKNHVPEKWQMEHDGIKFWAKLAPFKHTGVFPEQASQWNYIYDTLNGKNASVLNLFAYTGIASLFAAKAGAKVTHLDASRPAISWANENRELNAMKDAPIRWIIDDAVKFTQREIKRGVKYDAIVMDPPVYGHGPAGEIWDFNKDFPKLLENCRKIISDSPLFVLVNAYAISSSSTTLANTLQGYFSNLGGNIENGELTLKEKSAGRLLSTGIWARWSK